MNAGLVADLAALQRMPTVSTGPSGRPALRRAAAWITERLTRLGATRVPLPAGGAAPVVAADRPGEPGAPTVLIYGHYDVVAAGPATHWSVPPYAAVTTGTTLWGRGASDDKGPLVAGLHAVGALAGSGRRVHLKFLYEGDEEIGSPGLAGTLRRLGGWLRDVDAVLVCDTESTRTGRPTLTHALRGELTLDVTAMANGRDLHSGRYGGVVPDPARALAVLISSLHEPSGRVTVPGFYLDARPPAERGTAAERAVTRPAVVVNALCAGRCQPGPWHVIPASATAKINVRLVADQRPAHVEHRLRAHLARHTPPGVRLRVDHLARVDPWRLADPDHPAIQAAIGAVRRVWGVPPALVSSGGSIPAAALLASAAPQAALVLLGVTLPGDNAHGTDEHVDLGRLDRTVRTIATWINEIGRWSL